jgi:hypothetical protein
MPVAGFERRAYMCSLCHETEQRLLQQTPPEERAMEVGTTDAGVEVGSGSFITLIS